MKNSLDTNTVVSGEKPEIEVTPEMIRAGISVVADWDDRFETSEQIVRSVYLAMVEAYRRAKVDSA